MPRRVPWSKLPFDQHLRIAVEQLREELKKEAQNRKESDPFFSSYDVVIGCVQRSIYDRMTDAQRDDLARTLLAYMIACGAVLLEQTGSIGLGPMLGLNYYVAEGDVVSGLKPDDPIFDPIKLPLVVETEEVQRGHLLMAQLLIVSQQLTNHTQAVMLEDRDRRIRELEAKNEQLRRYLP